MRDGFAHNEKGLRTTDYLLLRYMQSPLSKRVKECARVASVVEYGLLLALHIWGTTEGESRVFGCVFLLDCWYFWSDLPTTEVWVYL